MRGGNVMATHKMALPQTICSCQLPAPDPAVSEPDVTIWHRQKQFNGKYSSIAMNTMQIVGRKTSLEHVQQLHSDMTHTFTAQLLAACVQFLKAEVQDLLAGQTHSSNRNDTLASPSAAPSKNLPAHKTAISTVPLEG
jgi:hypothetical protein